MSSTDPSIVDVLKTTVADAQALVRSEIALAKAEMREEVSRVGAGATRISVAAVFGLMALGLILVAVALALSELLLWPLWAGFGVTALAVMLIAAIVGYLGAARLRAPRRMPLTVDTMKENAEWMRARTS